MAQSNNKQSRLCYILMRAARAEERPLNKEDLPLLMNKIMLLMVDYLAGNNANVSLLLGFITN
jgi:hypothetical protein